MSERHECEECWTDDTSGGWGLRPDGRRIWVCWACVSEAETGLVCA